MTQTRLALNFQEGETEGNDLEYTHTVRQTQGESKFKIDQSNHTYTRARLYITGVRVGENDRELEGCEQR